ncbi:MAG: hypothetical protein KAW88_07340 [Candidatus Cloacimonetes bacterium]|nr:hypothetical protein [Candidatus Cloacimonadota bacterium]
MLLADEGEMMVPVFDNKEYDKIIVIPKNTGVALPGSLFMIIRKVG